MIRLATRRIGAVVRWVLALGAVAPMCGSVAAQVDGSVDGIEVLQRGPVHEAFAEPFRSEVPDLGPLVVRRPPELIEELPPEVRPSGQRVEWVPGYWFWSGEREAFVWVSGVWRTPPPGCAWVPGFWRDTQGGFRWVAGYWGQAVVEVASPIPMPPDTLEAGPSSPAPSGNHFWIPGCWIWKNHHFLWRAGFWHAGHAGWVWVPSRYVLTSHGCHFVAGYWDLPLERRGWLYAPVAISPTVVLHPHWVYRPHHCVDSSLLLSALMVNSHSGHYHFGVYESRQRVTLGLHFWFESGVGRHCHYDPFDAYYRCHMGSRRRAWIAELKGEHARLVANHRPHPRAGVVSKQGGTRGGAPSVRRGRPQEEPRHLVARVNSSKLAKGDRGAVASVSSAETEKWRLRRDRLRHEARRRAQGDVAPRTVQGNRKLPSAPKKERPQAIRTSRSASPSHVVERQPMHLRPRVQPQRGDERPLPVPYGTRTTLLGSRGNDVSAPRPERPMARVPGQGPQRRAGRETRAWLESQGAQATPQPSPRGRKPSQQPATPSLQRRRPDRSKAVELRRAPARAKVVAPSSRRPATHGAAGSHRSPQTDSAEPRSTKGRKTLGSPQRKGGGASGAHGSKSDKGRRKR